MKDDDQPTSFYGLCVGEVSADLDDRISSPSSGKCSKKVLKLLAYPSVRSRRFCRFEGEELSEAFENLNKPDVILSSSEAKDMEAAMRSIVEATS